MQSVFLVEDSASIRERLVRLLESVPGAQVVGQAGDADEAIAAILAARPDVVLLDVQLEQSSGFEVLRAVHSLEPRIAFYMLSNFATEPYRRHAERLGARGFFDKSTDFDRLRDLVAQHAASQ
jgi:two-component system, OmpR family, response regulator